MYSVRKDRDDEMTNVDIDAEKEILKRLGPLTTITPKTKNPEELLKYFAEDAVLQPTTQPTSDHGS